MMDTIKKIVEDAKNDERFMEMYIAKLQEIAGVILLNLEDHPLTNAASHEEFRPNFNGFGAPYMFLDYVKRRASKERNVWLRENSVLERILTVLSQGVDAFISDAVGEIASLDGKKLLSLRIRYRKMALEFIFSCAETGMAPIRDENGNFYVPAYREDKLR